MAKYTVLIFGGIVLFILGLLLGRTSVTQETVPLLPTRLPATPENYLAQINATPVFFMGSLDSLPTPMPRLTGDLARGQELYAPCIHCHGEFGGGEPGNPNSNIPDQYGYMRVPRHDSAGHTWLHPDQLLLEVIKKGSINPLYRQTMPAFESVYTDEEIMLIIEYMKLWWTEEQREQQAAVTERLRLARENP